jgi:hypothetical protein
MSDFISPQDLKVVDRVLDDILLQFPEREEIDYEDKIWNILAHKVGDVVVVLRGKYNCEADMYMEGMAKYYERGKPVGEFEEEV